METDERNGSATDWLQTLGLGRKELRSWALAIGVAMVQGGIQALSRSLFASMIPEGRSTEFFGFYSVSSKFAGIAGPIVFASAGQAMGSSRWGILSLVAFFAVGAVLLARVDVDEGRLEARRDEERMRVVPATRREGDV